MTTAHAVDSEQGHDERKPERRWRPWLRVLAAVIVPFALGEVLSLAAGAAGATDDEAGVVFYLGALAAVLALARGDLRRLLGIVWPGWAVAAAALAAGAARAAVWVVTLPTHGADQAAWPLAGAIATQLLVVAVVEEAQMRGLVLSRLQSVCTLPLAIAASSVLFAVIHLHDASWQLLPTYFADGVLFAVARWRGRSLLPAIIIHAVFNVTTVCLPVAASVADSVVYRYEIAVVLTDAILVTLMLVLGRPGRRTP